MYQFIDTHTHLNEPEFDSDRDAVILRAKEAGAKRLFIPNCSEKTIGGMLDLCRRYEHLCFPMMGLHPEDVSDDSAAVLDRMEQLLSRQPSPYIAIGEVGLDFYWDMSHAAEQERVFMRQVDWALRLGLPLMLHTRAAERRVCELLWPYRDVLTGVFHCFTGDEATARQMLDFPHFAIGLGGVATFKKSSDLRQTISNIIPMERVVVETDAPYMTPVPHRGQRNEPSFVPCIIETLAQCYGLTPEQVAIATTQNAARIFPRAFADLKEQKEPQHNRT